MFHPPFLVTGIRVLDLICPMAIGGTLSVSGDQGSGVNVLCMETMQNLCRRYAAKAAVRFTVAEPFNESNVIGWINKLNVVACVREAVLGARAEISIQHRTLDVATLRPFADRTDDADAWVVLRRSLFEAGRLPPVELSETGSKLAATDDTRLAQRVKEAVAQGNAGLTRYLSQPFFVAEPWTFKPGEETEREQAVEGAERLIAGP